DVAGVVGTAVVHTHHVRENQPQLIDHVADDARFVEGGHHDPDVTRFTGHIKPTRYTQISGSDEQARPGGRRCRPAGRTAVRPRSGSAAAAATTAAASPRPSRTPSP